MLRIPPFAHTRRKGWGAQTGSVHFRPLADEGRHVEIIMLERGHHRSGRGHGGTWRFLHVGDHRRGRVGDSEGGGYALPGDGLCRGGNAALTALRRIALEAGGDHGDLYSVLGLVI